MTGTFHIRAADLNLCQAGFTNLRLAQKQTSTEGFATICGVCTCACVCVITHGPVLIKEDF